MNRFKPMLTTAALTTLLVAGTVGASQMYAFEQTQEQQRATAVDSGYIAKASGIPVDRMRSKLTAQQNSGALIESLRREHGSRLAGIYFDAGAQNRIVVRLIGNARVAGKRASEQVGTERIAIEYVYGAGRTQQALDTMLVRGMPQVKRSLPSFQGGYADESTGEIVLYVLGRDASKRKTARSLFANAPVRLEVLSEPLQQQAMGGGHVTNGSSVCTAGFSIHEDNRTGRKGITTAGHCSNNYNSYQGPDGSSSIVYTREGYNANSDWQLQDASNVTPKFIYNQSWNTRTVTGTVSRSSLASGRSVCHYGRTSGYSCGTVSSTSFRPSWSCGGSTCNAVFVSVTGSGLKCLGGDGGGPWFSGSLAVGGHSGGSPTSTGCSLAIFTSVDWLSNINAAVLR